MNPYRRILPIILLAGMLLAPYHGYGAAISYQYDRLNRLTSVRYGDGTRITYSYDPAGNRLSRSIITNGTSPVGDFNDDGSTNLQDAILVLQIVAGLNPSGIRSDYAVSGTDAGGNQKIGLEDVIYILQKTAALR